MATESKVREFLKATDLAEQMKQVVQQICQGMKANYEKQSENFEAETVDAFNKLYNFIVVKMEAVTLSLYQDLYSDEELDELIDILQRPIFVRMRQQRPEVTSRVIAFLKENEQAINEKAERLMSEVLAKTDNPERTRDSDPLLN